MARYIEIEQIQSKQEANGKLAQDRYALERKVNKAKPSQLVEWICSNELKPTTYLYKSNYYEEWNLMQQIAFECKDSNEFTKLATHIAEWAPNFYYDKANIKALKGIKSVYNEKIRSIQSWTPKKVNYKTVLVDLLNHLFTIYKTPTFLINGFIINNLESMLLFIHLGNGKSMKTFPFIPEFNIPKKALHHLNTTPNYCTYNEAFRRTQIIHLGGDDKLFRLLMSTKLEFITNNINKNRIKDEPFWESVIKFFIEHQMMNPDKVPEIIDYIYDQKFTLKRKPGPNGTLVNEPDQPNFTMKGRTPMSLIQHSDDWHYFITMNKKREQDAKEWEPIDIPDWEFKEEHIKYEITQLTKTKELIAEGNKMHHCVASYASSCIKKWCSIFSFRITNHNQGKFADPEVTLEIRNNTIVQAKGRYNKNPHPYHMQMIKSWANTNGLKISNYIV
jgi:hypothetical protein